ncbi:hypothetical protein RIF29_17907 [Crotalaria pallida]|uniref:Uncharacterized protein n=1 Tax=Crotalaria pallida TaxID=3830 RepID=A0AAN9IKK1_CROPI
MSKLKKSRILDGLVGSVDYGGMVVGLATIHSHEAIGTAAAAVADFVAAVDYYGQGFGYGTTWDFDFDFDSGFDDDD